MDCCDRSYYMPGEQEKHMQAVDIELMIQEGLISVFGTNLPGIGQLTILTNDNGPRNS